MNIPNGHSQIVPKKCPVCESQRKYLVCESVNSVKNRTMFYVTCENCKAAIVFFVSQNEVGTMTVGVLTDLSNKEVKKFFGSKPITGNDVLDIYEYLNKSDNVLSQSLLSK